MTTLVRQRWGRAGIAALLLLIGFMAGRGSRPHPRPGLAAASLLPTQALALKANSLPERLPASGDEASRAPAPKATWHQRWNELQAQLPGAAREKAMADALRELAATDPDGALALAQQETNFRLRQDLLGAALQGWATINPGASVGWASTHLFDAERRTAVEAIIDAGMARRDETIQAVNALCERDAAMADDYGRMLIASLAKNSDFATAVSFATANTSSHKDYWLGAALYSWSQYRPQEAAEALKTITDPAAYNEAIHGLILGWSSNDPVSLVKFAERLPAGPARQEAFNQALQNWVTHDPVAASVWLDAHEATPELDSGAVKLATSPYLVEKNLETALSWAKSVSDPQQRTIALVDVIQQWAQRDPVAARLYAEALPEGALQTDYRALLLKDLAAAP